MLALDLLIFAIASTPPTGMRPMPPPAGILKASPPASPPPPPPRSYDPNDTRPQPIETDRWFDGMLYPSAALRDGREGVVSYQLIIDPAGRPTDCRILASSGHSDLDSATCDLLVKGARFRPALYYGKPVGSWYRGRMRWVLPEEQKNALPDDAGAAAPPTSAPVVPAGSPGPSSARPIIDAANPWVSFGDYPPLALSERRGGVVSYRLQIDKTGTPTDCAILTSSGHLDLDFATCALLVKNAKFSPARGLGGEAVPSTYINRVAWVLPKQN